MNARVSPGEAAVPDVSMPELRSASGFVGTAVFAVVTLGATVVVFAAFVALLIGGAGGARGLFALTAGSMAFGMLSLAQFLRFAVVLLGNLRGRAS